MGEEMRKKVSISIVGKRQPHKLPSLFAAIDDARSAVPAPAAAPAWQFVVEFDPSQAPAPAAAPVVIAPLPNSGIFGRRKPSPLLAASGSLPAFELDTSTAADDAAFGTHYGLTTRRDAVDDAPDRGMEEFRGMPVEGFGAAILAGYGLTVTKEEDTNTITKAADRGAKHGLGYNPSEAYNYKRSSRKRPRTEACQKDYCDVRHKRHGEKRSRTDACDNSRDGGGESKVRWLQSRIRVRVVSEKLGRRLYLTKG